MSSEKPPTVSVVMPVYNVERFVAEAIRSVLDQSYEDFELIIVDDGGCDGSVDICRGFHDPRIRIISQLNGGLAAARNTGIASSQGRYIALLDSDDAWATDKLARHVEHLDANPQVGASYAGSELRDAAGNALGILQLPKLGRARAKDVFCGRAILNGSSPVFRRAMLEESALPSSAPGRLCIFDESLRRSEDVECWTRLALTSRFEFEGIAGALTYYRVSASGLSADVIKQLDSWDAVFARLAPIDPAFIAAHGKEARSRELRYLARRCVQMRDRGLGLSLAWEGLRHFPLLLLLEPAKTATTLLACLLMRLLPRSGFDGVLGLLNPILAVRVAS
jgi:glycosyltransferase involved in cell wall biosynthesis